MLLVAIHALEYQGLDRHLSGTHKAAQTKQGVTLQPTPVGRPMHCVGIDIVGPLPRTFQGNAYLLVMMDYFTKVA